MFFYIINMMYCCCLSITSLRFTDLAFIFIHFQNLFSEFFPICTIIEIMQLSFYDKFLYTLYPVIHYFSNYFFTSKNPHISVGIFTQRDYYGEVEYVQDIRNILSHNLPMLHDSILPHFIRTWANIFNFLQKNLLFRIRQLFSVNYLVRFGNISFIS